MEKGIHGWQARELDQLSLILFTDNLGSRKGGNDANREFSFNRLAAYKRVRAGFDLLGTGSEARRMAVLIRPLGQTKERQHGLTPHHLIKTVLSDRELSSVRKMRQPV